MASKAPDTSPGLADKLKQAGLDPIYWVGILESKLDITLPQQIQYLDETDLKALEGSIRRDWEKKGLRKFLGFIKDPTSIQAEKDVKSKIVMMLNEAGLDGKYWADVLKVKLGITRPEQIENLNINDLEMIRNKVRYDWEENALRKCFCITDKAFDERKNEQEKIQKEAQNLIRDVTELRQKGIHYTDIIMKSRLEQLRKLMAVSNDQWIDRYDDKSLDDMIGKMSSDLKDIDKLVKGRPVNSAAEILEKASAGLALRGILVCKDVHHGCLKRVLSTPTDVKLMNPVMTQIDEVVNFSSKAQSDHFHRSLDTLGYSVASGVKCGRRGFKVGDWVFKSEASFTTKHEDEDEKESESHQHTNFESRVSYSVVPTAACELNPCSLKLSEEALQALKTIDKLLVACKSQELVHEQCEEFIRAYGSHINTGVLHFGGVNRFVATYRSETRSKTEKTKSMIRDALSAYASASYSGFIFSLGGSISLDLIKTHGTFTNVYEKSEQAKTNLHTTRNGGPQEVSALPLWKMGLVTCNSTWALIDRGKLLSTDFIGIWTLIPNHRGDFQKSDELESSLISVWERISGNLESSKELQTFKKGFNAMDLMIDQIAKWNSHSLLPEMCIEYLTEIVKIVDQVAAQTGSNEYWVDKICTEVKISNFLGKVVALRDRFNPKDVPMIQLLIRKLVTPVELRGFPGKQDIIKWVKVINDNDDAPSLLANTVVKSIPDLINNLKERLIPTLQTGCTRNEEQRVEVFDGLNKETIEYLALCFGHLLKDLQTSGKSREMFFLKIALMSLHYHWPTLMFGTLLTIKKLQDFVISTEVLWKEFQVHQEKGIIQLEAFLIHMSITSGHFDMEKESSEDAFSEAIEEVRKVLSPKLNSVLNRYTTKSPYNWVGMINDTAELAKGNMSVTEDSKVSIGVLEKMGSPEDRKTKEEGLSMATKSGVVAQVDFLDILETLGLDNYYPSKISLLDAIVIKKAPGHIQLVDLPWMMIQKLLMIDFNSRDKLWSGVEISSREETPDVSDGFDFEAFIHRMQNASDGENKATQINTLDALVAIFTCCDNLLRQTLAQKLFVCKLAIPFLYPLGTEGKIGMSLWALRTITVQHKGASETPVTGVEPFPLVSFVRLGRPLLSKSKLINDILSDGSHDTFFHHDCNNGTVDRKVTDGLVECSWLIATGKENEHPPPTAMFLNLRGDASLMSKQMEILQKISSVVFAITTAQDLAKPPNTEKCKQILQTDAKVILFVISGNTYQSKQELLACYTAVGKDFLKGARVITSITQKGVQKNASDLKTEAREKLSETIAECFGITMEECARRASEMGIIVDEFDDGACIKGKTNAERVVSHMKNKNIVECKRTLLPLQGVEWMEYCKLLKSQHRASGKVCKTSSAFHAEQVQQQMNRLREQQVDICCSRLSPLITDFMSFLGEETDVVLYFLKWMKLMLDEISRANLPELRRNYHMEWKQFQEAKRKHEKLEMDRLKIRVSDAENQLAIASLGVENLFREIGQIYEAVEGCGKIAMGTRAAVERLPEEAATLLLKGIPLEVIDGDASGVPIVWMRAVLNKLEKNIGEKRLFVLSVLGIQSSGKSTLLNTMFGLEFTVSAGRCTRGAYMQLIPVNEHADLPFHYVVVVDTEGLRAPELGHLKREHDNELATLVIGLGDVTVINIKGENTAEMKDTLQIAVHAFLRMNLVRKHIRDHRTCVFVHQNVPAVNAKEMMASGCQILQENLDDMAKEAALSENIADIDSFSQIINFDVKKHVWYFSDLWHGNPPMAPANHGYSEQVGAVRMNLLHEIAKMQTSFLTTADLSIRLNDLWKGVLADDFVFSFRNSLEVKAYNSMQSEYYTLEWELQSELKSWLQAAENSLKICESIANLEETCKILTKKFHEVLEVKSEESRNYLKKYFQSCNLQDVTVQWQQSKLNLLSIVIEQQQIEGERALLSIKESCQVEISQAQKRSKHEERIMIKATELADKLKDKKVTSTELQNKFDDMWVTIVNDLTTKTADEKLRMDSVMDQILHRRFHAHGSQLRKELKCHRLDVPLKQTSLQESISLDFVKPDHISLKSSMWEDLKIAVGFNDKELQARYKTVVLTCSILEDISTYLTDLSKRDVKLQTNHATEVINKVVEAIDSYNKTAIDSKKCNFTIRSEYVVKLAVHVSRHCVKVFTLMQSEYNEKHGVKAKLQKYKDTTWSFFENMVKQRTEEVIAGDILCTHLKGIIQETVKEKMPRKCIDEVLRDFQMNKYYLIVDIMEDLAKKGNFKEYESYITDAKYFALNWITKYTKQKMFSKLNARGVSRYKEIQRDIIAIIVQRITESVHVVTAELEGEQGRTMKKWIDKFSQRVSKVIVVQASALTYASARRVVNFNNLKRIILEKLLTFENSLEEALAKEDEVSAVCDRALVPQQILDMIWGCPEQCPFCHEPCRDRTPGHYPQQTHRCLQHRPKGVAGVRWDKDSVVDGQSVYNNELLVETCNYEVQRENVTFSCRVVGFKCRNHRKCVTTGENTVFHDYIEYKTYLPEWDIGPDTTNTVSKYWMWFMATYQHQLKDMHKAKLPNIPKSWRDITMEEALADLRKYHT